MASRPNILILTADQLAQRAMGCYGNPLRHTPRIDGLAERGVAFTNAYTTCPLCMPARAAVWTGQLPHRTGVTTNARDLAVPADIPTLGVTFAAAGYRCTHFGKAHDCGALRGFEMVPNSGAPVEETPPWTNYYDSQEDRATTLQAVDFLDKQGPEPWVMAVEYNNPHDICLWIGEHIGPHVDTPVPGPLPPLPENFEDADLAARPRNVQYNCCSNFRVAQTLQWTPENFRYYLAAYYHYVDLLDAEISRVLDALARRPDAGNTIVVFYADHGEGMASHRAVTKGGHFYEETVLVPLLFTGVGITARPAPARVPLASLVDVFPTLCDCAGLRVPDGLAGRSLRPWLCGHGPRDTRPYVVSHWRGDGKIQVPARMLRTHRYKYNLFREDGVEELFDLATDPGERINLAPDPAAAAVLEEHRARLRAYCVETGDAFFEEPVCVASGVHTHPSGQCPSLR
jgi:choline-sulfatase